MNDIAYQGQGRIEDVIRAWPNQIGPPINNLEIRRRQRIENDQNAVLEMDRDQGMAPAIVDYRQPNQVNNEVVALQNRVTELEIQNERLKNNHVRNNLEPRLPAPRSLTQEQINAVSKAIRIANLTFNDDQSDLVH